MGEELEVFLLGELRVVTQGQERSLPASKKARALLAFLVATGRPHRRERLCELFWNVPDDPKAALRWALSKLRRVVDAPDNTRIIADRERVHFNIQNACVDIRDIHTSLREGADRLSIPELEAMAGKLDGQLLGGLDNAGDDAFATWLIAERVDAERAHVEVLRRLATHKDMDPMSARKWLALWSHADPEGAAEYQDREPEQKSSQTALHSQKGFPAQRSSGKSGAKQGRRVETAGLVSADALRAQKIGFCEVADGTKIAYATIGSGPPLLKAANWLNHLEFDWASPIWGQSFATMARNRTFIRYDERGCGLSDWDVSDLSFDAFVEDLEAVADKLKLERFPLLGISQGCAVSIEYAVRHPERVSALVLISGYAAGWRHLATPEEQARREAVLTLTELGWGTDNPAYRHIFSQTFLPDASAEDLEWFDEFQRQTTSPRNAARFQDAFGYIDVRDRLAKVKAPTIVLHAKYDQRIPLELGRALAAGIPDAQFVPLESRNHILVDYEPALKVCLDTVNRFLEEKGL
ncbi:alpha/beta hydrolase [Roseibium aggregatum]|uniref:Alpha/beta fold hydrolase n=1 Tax=Roseibium aggregatum TaxID=187304 RepID=A0A939EG16_9HYPH|nr:alpha/beta hydrolase [Roseibium aggregatum]MBN9672557.1 alpha/beta fold hydrolase [Roseibium aggregatum]